MFLLAELRRGAPQRYPVEYVPGYRVRIRSGPFDLYQRGLRQEIGGAHGVLVTAVSRRAFAQARYDPARRYRRAQRLAPGNFPLPFFSTALNGITVRGSIVGTRRDLQKSLELAAEGGIRARIHTERPENISSVFANLKNDKIDDRAVLTLD
jgi:propanol-preferring alcohol dehydrogenase